MYASISLEAQVYVLTLAREGSFHRAAKQLNVSQPALTRKINAVEKQLGVKLFHRAYHRLELTEAGKLFVPEAQASLNHAERAWELARRQRQIETGPLRIGYSPNIHVDLLPLLQRWQIENGDATRVVFLESAVTMELKERVLQGKLHMAFGISPILDEELWIVPVAKEPFCVCIPKNHRLAQKAVISTKDMHQQVVYWLPKGLHPHLYDKMLEYIDGLGVQLILREVSAATEAMDTVAHGFGLAMLPHSMTRFSRMGVVLKPLTDMYLQIETVLFTRQNQRRSLQEEIQLIFALVRSAFSRTKMNSHR